MNIRLASIFLVVCGGILLIGCGSEEPVAANNEPATVAEGNSGQGDELKEKEQAESVEPLDNAAFAEVYAAADKEKGTPVQLQGKIFLQPERDADGTYFQMYADPENMDLNTIVGIADPDLDVKEGDFVKVNGTIEDMMSGENAFGANLNLPVVRADQVTVVDYISAVSPTLKEVKVNKAQDQHGFELTLEKIEFSEKETRVYVNIANKSDYNLSFYSFDSKATQGNKQFETEDNFDAGYPEVQSEILPGVESSGVVTFPAMDLEAKKATFIFEGSSENWEAEFQPFQFEISW